MKTVTAEQYEEMARKCENDARESFIQCDTDGFVTQFCDSLTAQKYRRQAEITRNGGVAEFPALFNLKGQRVKARLSTRRDPISFRYEDIWKFYDANDRYVGYVSAEYKRIQTLIDYGYIQGTELAPAEARIGGSGTGFSGLSSCYVYAHRLDNGYPENAIAES